MFSRSRLLRRHQEGLAEISLLVDKVNSRVRSPQNRITLPPDVFGATGKLDQAQLKSPALQAALKDMESTEKLQRQSLSDLPALLKNARSGVRFFLACHS